MSVIFAERPLDHRAGFSWHLPPGLLGLGPMALIGASLDARRQKGLFQITAVLLLLCFVAAEAALLLGLVDLPHSLFSERE